MKLLLLPVLVVFLCLLISRNECRNTENLPANLDVTDKLTENDEAQNELSQSSHKLNGTSTSEIKPVLLMHGMLSSYKKLETLKGYIEEAFPGTAVYLVDAFNDLESVFVPMWRQVNGTTAVMEDIMAKHPEGVNLICTSQGGLICRGMLQTSDKHNVQTFVTLSSPLAGQFGTTDYLKWLFPNILKKNLHKHLYKTSAQNLLSFAGFWKDPFHLDLYEKENLFLPVLNGEVLPRDKRDLYRENFTRLKKFVMIGGPDDGVITPWQSSHFQFYGNNTDEEVEEMIDMPYFLNDAFGLMTLWERGALSTFSVPGVVHEDWHDSKEVFDNFIKPFLL